MEPLCYLRCRSRGVQLAAKLDRRDLDAGEALQCLFRWTRQEDVIHYGATFVILGPRNGSRGGIPAELGPIGRLGLMKISKVETFLVPPRWLFVKMETNEGIFGWGEA